MFLVDILGSWIDHSCYPVVLALQFVTRAVRVVDLITNLDMQAFQSYGGMTAFINRLQVSFCVYLMTNVGHANL